LYLSGQSRRWVQFYPYVTDVPDTWSVELQTENGKFELQSLDLPTGCGSGMEPALAGSGWCREHPEDNLPAVFLNPSRKQDRQPTTVRHMPAEIFLPTRQLSVDCMPYFWTMCRTGKSRVSRHF
jgi:hypothetical protein